MHGDAVRSLNGLFKQLKVKAEVSECRREDSFLICDVSLLPGGTYRKLEQFSTEIALALKLLSEPLIYPVTNEGVVRMEMMIAPLETVMFRDIVSSPEFKDAQHILPLALGRQRGGRALVTDLIKMPHLLVGGATGSGKSVLLHTIVNSLLVGPSDCRLALVDPKRVEFSHYDRHSDLYCPIARSTEDSIEVLRKVALEMEDRFVQLEKAGCRDISCYKRSMPRVVLVIDELADLMMASKREVQDLICRLAQKSRACGIHIVAATQRPSVDVITGLIKANFPSRISCRVSSAVDSRTILDHGGAEKLSGNGDAIIDCQDYKFCRFKGAFIGEQEMTANTKEARSWWKRVWNS
jgi:S-DNA-T family DNA segregation ATPase FtsK/SpoIIIE